MYQPANEAWQLSVFGTNLTNEWYVNGGFDHSLFLGYDIGLIGRPREVGIGLRFVFDSSMRPSVKGHDLRLRRARIQGAVGSR